MAESKFQTGMSNPGALVQKLWKYCNILPPSPLASARRVRWIQPHESSFPGQSSELRFFKKSSVRRVEGIEYATKCLSASTLRDTLGGAFYQGSKFALRGTEV